MRPSRVETDANEPRLRRARLQALGVAVLLAALGIFVLRNLRVSTDITHFLPPGEDADAARIASLLGDAEGARTELVSIEAGSAIAASSCSRALAERLRTVPGVAWARSTSDPGLEQA